MHALIRSVAGFVNPSPWRAAAAAAAAAAALPFRHSLRAAAAGRGNRPRAMPAGEGCERRECVYRKVSYICLYTSMRRWMDGWMDGWMDMHKHQPETKQTDEYVCMYVCMYTRSIYNARRPARPGRAFCLWATRPERAYAYTYTRTKVYVCRNARCVVSCSKAMVVDESACTFLCVSRA